MTTSSPSPTKPPPPLDPLVLQNKLAVSLSQKRKLISSWLPAPTESELAKSKSAEEIAAEDETIWKPRPPTLGVGHPVPASADNYNREDDLLRRRLLGQNAVKDARQRHLERTQQQQQRRGGYDDASSSDEETISGRASVAKKSTKRQKVKNEGSDEDESMIDSTASGAQDTENEGTKKEREPGESNGKSEDDAAQDGGFVSLPIIKKTPSASAKKKQYSGKHQATPMTPKREEALEGQGDSDGPEQSIMSTPGSSDGKSMGKNKKKKNKKSKVTSQ